MLLDELKKKCNDKEINFFDLLNIMVYINNFFCFYFNYKCMDKLIRFLDRYWGVNLILYVISLYKICCEICRNECYYNGVGDRDYMINYVGLKKIMGYECCEIKVFIKKDWKDLFGFVNVL